MSRSVWSVEDEYCAAKGCFSPIFTVHDKYNIFCAEHTSNDPLKIKCVLVRHHDDSKYCLIHCEEGCKGKNNDDEDQCHHMKCIFCCGGIKI